MIKFYSLNMIVKPKRRVENIDSKYYAILWVILQFINEDESIYQNISISPLWQLQEDEYFIKISFFEEEIYKRFFDIMSWKINETLHIDGLPFQFVWFILDGENHIFDFEKELSNETDDYNWIKLNFLSPTIVKSSPIYKLLPLPHIYIYSIISKFEKILGEENFFNYFWFKNTKKIKAMIEDTIVESAYDLQSEKVFIKWWYIPGNIWRVSYAINKEHDEAFDILKPKLPIFINWAKWTWLWFGTRLGLGQVEWEVY